MNDNIARKMQQTYNITYWGEDTTTRIIAAILVFAQILMCLKQRWI